MQPLVLDLTRLLPGPLAARILGDMGWRIHRLVPPAGDPLLRMQPELYRWLNSGKPEEVCDLKTDAGRSRLTELARAADVLIETNRPGVMERLGVGPDTLCALNPRLTYIRIAGFRDPEFRTAPGHDLTYLAASGLLPGFEPAWRQLQLADTTGAMWAALAAVEGVRRGGGFHEVVLEDTARVLAYPTPPGLDGRTLCYALYPAAEGEVAVAALEPHLWAALCRAFERDEWTDAAFTPAVPENPVFRELSDLLAGRTAAEWDAWAGEHALPLRAVRAGAVPERILPWGEAG